MSHRERDSTRGNLCSDGRKVRAKALRVVAPFFIFRSVSWCADRVCVENLGKAFTRPPTMRQQLREVSKKKIGVFGVPKKEGTSGTFLPLRCCEAQERVIFPGSFSALRYVLPRTNSEEQAANRCKRESLNRRRTIDKPPRNSRGTVEREARKNPAERDDDKTHSRELNHGRTTGEP